MTHHIDIERYLERIDYHEPRDPAPETLRALQRAHLLAVPFENLDIHPPFQREISLDPAWLEAKIVGARRGGFCYELNGLFAALLCELGFAVTLLSASVRRPDGGFGPDFDHLLLRVDLDGEPWLADVGFGELSLDPLRLTHDEQTDERGNRFRLDPDGEHLTLMRAEAVDEEWKPQYRFSLTPRELVDFAEMCRFQQTSPESHFTLGRVCSIYTPAGRISLTGRRLIITDAGERTEYPIDGDAAFLAALAEHFGIVPGGSSAVS